MGHELEIRRFGPNPPAPGVAFDLHSRMLPDSLVCRLGRPFADGFYYSTLCAEGILFGAVAYVDGKPAGMAAAAWQSDGFMSRGIQRGRAPLARALARSIWEKPSRLATLAAAVRLMSARKALEGPREPLGEILTLAVSPEFSTREFKQATGVRVAVELVKDVMRRFSERGVQNVRAVVDAGNARERRRAEFCGYRLVRENVPGEPKSSVEYWIRPDELRDINELEFEAKDAAGAPLD